MIDDPRSAVPNLLTAGRSRRALVIAIACAAAVSLLAGGLVLASHLRRGRTLDSAGRGFARLEACLLGSPRLVASESPSPRLRLVRLGRRGRDPRAADWPRRCTTYAREIAQALKGLGFERESARGLLHAETLKVEVALARGELPRVEAMWSLARSLLPAVAPGDVVPAPPPQTPLSGALLARLPEHVTAAIAGAPTFARPWLLLRTPDSKDGRDDAARSLCRLAATTAGPKLVCHDVSTLIPLAREARPAVLDHDDPELPHLAVLGAAEASGVYAITGQKLMTTEARQVAGGMTRGAGFAVITRSAEGFFLSDDNAERPFPSLFEARSVEQHGEDAVWIEADGLVRRFLRVRSIWSKDGVLLPVADGLELASGCRTPKLLALRLEGADRVAMVLRDGDADGKWGRIIEFPGVPRGTAMACHGREATLTWRVRGGGDVHQVRCSPATCLRLAGPAPGVPRSATVVELDGKVLAVWTQGGATWARIGAADALADADDRMLIDDARHGGLTATIAEVAVSGQAALVILRETSGQLSVLALDRSGRAQAIPIEHVC